MTYFRSILKDIFQNILNKTIYNFGTLLLIFLLYINLIKTI